MHLHRKGTIEIIVGLCNRLHAQLVTQKMFPINCVIISGTTVSRSNITLSNCFRINFPGVMQLSGCNGNYGGVMAIMGV